MRRLTLVRLRTGAWSLERVPGRTVHHARSLTEALAYCRRNGAEIVHRKIELANGQRVNESEVVDA